MEDPTFKLIFDRDATHHVYDVSECMSGHFEIVLCGFRFIGTAPVLLNGVTIADTIVVTGGNIVIDHATGNPVCDQNGEQILYDRPTELVVNTYLLRGRNSATRIKWCQAMQPTFRIFAMVNGGHEHLLLDDNHKYELLVKIYRTHDSFRNRDGTWGVNTAALNIYP